MPRFVHRLRVTLARIVNPPGTSLLDAVFDGGHTDPAPPTADHGAAVRAGSRLDRLRPQRRDLSAALRSGAGSPDQELAAWPPVTNRDRACQPC